MKRLISILIVFTIILGSISSIYAGDALNTPQKFLTKEELQKEINFLNEKYPDANLLVDDFLRVDELMAKMAEEERFSFTINSLQAAPERVCYHEDDFGIDSILLILLPGIVTECGRTLGGVSNDGSYIYYSGTSVFLSNLIGCGMQNLSYSVNHKVSYDDYSGTVIWSGNVQTYDGSNVVLNNGQMMVSVGPEVYARAYYCERPIGAGGIILPTNPVYLYFNATSFNVSVRF